MHYDVVIVGAGPTGCLCALAHARRGARVALLEANPDASNRLAGEWLHPRAVRILREFEIDLESQPGCVASQGFAVFPEDGSEPIVLPYPDDARGIVCEHATLVSRLRAAVENEPGIDYIVRARVREIADDKVAFAHNGVDESVTAGRIVGADGRSSIVRRSLGLKTSVPPYSGMLGIMLEGVDVPIEGYGHVFSGGPGPVLIYGLGERYVRIFVDIPKDYWGSGDWIDFVSDSYAGVMPEPLRPAFIESLKAKEYRASANGVRRRVTYGAPNRVLIGDAAGYYHPLTAVGITLGFGDAIALAEADTFREFTSRRLQETRVPEWLAIGFYEVFAVNCAETNSIRREIYRNWRLKPAERDRTMSLLSCEETSAVYLGRAFCTTVFKAVARELPRTCDLLAWRRVRHLVYALAVRILSLLRGVPETAQDQEARAKRTMILRKNPPKLTF